MAFLEYLGITKSKDGTRKGFSGADLGITIIAIGCVSLLSRAWIFSTIILVIGVILLTVGIAKGSRSTNQD